MPAPAMPTLLDLWLTAAIGFLGSFGHCIGMCGPITAAFALSVSNQPSGDRSQRQTIIFHLLLNLGRLASYALVGALIGGLGSVLFAGGQMAGIGSGLRRAVSVLTGVLLMWFGFTQAQPGFLPPLPFLHPARQQRIHEQINRWMQQVSNGQSLLAPLVLGLLWGLIPCGFLYTGQLRAAGTQSLAGGGAVMLAFGAGTLPAMLAMGLATSALSQDRRSQLFRLGGWMTVLIGALLLLRTGSAMNDYSGHAALGALILALAARPISKVWDGPLKYRRVLGVGAFALSLLHVLHMISHSWQWNWQAVQFMLPAHQRGIWLGAIALFLMLPAALTSFDQAQKKLGNRWRKLHLLSVPALLLAAAHTVLTGPSYWGSLALTWQHQARAGTLALAVVGVLALRSRPVWTLFSQAQNYAPPKSKALSIQAQDCCHADPQTSQPDSRV
ncbi:MAG: sulfite exporter TauE/SafE family protein [Cyanobacteria bacterium J06627_32]